MMSDQLCFGMLHSETCQWTEALAAITASTGNATAFLLDSAPGSSIFFRSRDADGRVCDEKTLEHEELLHLTMNSIARGMAGAQVGRGYDRRAVVPDEVVEQHPLMERFRQDGIFHGLLANLYYS